MLTIANTIRFAAICLVSLTTLVPAAAAGLEFWVSTTGNDAGAGTREEPFATLPRARDAVREARRGGLPRGGATVWLRGGVDNVIPRAISIRSNFLSLSGGRMPEEVQQQVIVRDNLTQGNPGLVAPDEGDFRLSDDSPARKLGFQPIPLGKIGSYQDEDR